MALRAMETSEAGEGRWRARVPSDPSACPPCISIGLPCAVGAWGLVLVLRHAIEELTCWWETCAWTGFAPAHLAKLLDSPGSRRMPRMEANSRGSDPGSRASQRTSWVGRPGGGPGAHPHGRESHWRKTEEQSPEARENVTRSGRGHRVNRLPGWLRPGRGDSQGPDHNGSCGPHRGGWAS